jgi:DNA (cytosine-5)-methyltransferase 1
MEHGDKLNAISLFSGIGGFELGIGDYCRTLLYCEADPHAQAVLLSRMAEGAIDVAPISTDVREITAEFVDMPIDIIFGGFPCQDISCAGKGTGLDGERSGLFFEIVRLAGEIKPTFLFLENVSAIRTRGLDRVILELTEVGYDLRWCMLSAADVGAPHRRERWFLLAARRDALANPESIGSGGALRDVSSENAEIGQSEEQHQDEARKSDAASSDPTVLADTESVQPRQQAERQWGEDTGRRSEDCRRAEREGETPMANPNSERWESKTGLGDREPLPTTPEGTTISGGQGIPSMADTESIGVQGLWTSGQPQPDPHGQSGLPVCQSENSGDERPTESIMGRVAHGISFDVVESRKAHLDPNYWKEEPEGIPRVTEDREQRVDRIKRLGNAVVPLQARTAFEYLMGIYKENNPNLIMPMPLIIPKPRPVVEYEEVEW